MKHTRSVTHSPVPHHQPALAGRRPAAESCPRTFPCVRLELSRGCRVNFSHAPWVGRKQASAFPVLDCGQDWTLLVACEEHGCPESEDGHSDSVRMECKAQGTRVWSAVEGGEAWWLLQPLLYLFDTSLPASHMTPHCLSIVGRTKSLTQPLSVDPPA